MTTHIRCSLEEELSQLAERLVDDFIHQSVTEAARGESYWPVSRSQITGLRLIALREPRQIEAFAQKQYEKAQARNNTAQVEFWRLIGNLFRRTANNVSLVGVRERYTPAELLLAARQGTPTAQQRQEESERRRQLGEWQRRWEEEYYPYFFVRLCIHYLYRMAQSAER